MGKKKPSTAAAKPADAKADKAKRATAAAASDIADIFSGIATPAPGKLSTSAAAASAIKAAAGKNGNASTLTTSDAVAAPAKAPVKPSGLFTAKSVAETAMTVTDESFFGETSEAKEQQAAEAAANGGFKKKKFKVTGSYGHEPGMRVIDEDDLATMITGNPNAGQTENCPFDCDCCF